MSGKGSAQRPIVVDKETFDKNWDRIFSENEEHPNCGTPECCNTCDPEEQEDETND